MVRVTKLSMITWARINETRFPAGVTPDESWWDLIDETEYDKRVSALAGGPKNV